MNFRFGQAKTGPIEDQYLVCYLQCFEAVTRTWMLAPLGHCLRFVDSR